MSGFAVITLGALLAISWMVVQMAKLPSTAKLSAATSTSPHAALSDRNAGLSYELLPSPWHDGCPMRDNPVGWTSGEGVLAGHVDAGGQRLKWYGNACAGLLPRGYTSADLAKEAAKAYDAIDTDSALSNHRMVTSSSALRVSGHKAWVVRFTVRFSAHGLPWSSEAGAVTVVDRGAGQAPAVLYFSVPSNLGGTVTVSTLISSLR